MVIERSAELRCTSDILILGLQENLNGRERENMCIGRIGCFGVFFFATSAVYLVMIVQYNQGLGINAYFTELGKMCHKILHMALCN